MKSKKFIIITDARKPQISGVVTVIEKLVVGLRNEGHKVILVSPNMFKTVPLPTYKEIQLSLLPNRKLKLLILREKPDYIHIATEGPLGLAGVTICNKLALNYTTAWHTKFPEYVNLRTRIPVSWLYKVLKLFHENASKILVTTTTMKKELENKGFQNLRVYPLGVDIKKFSLIQNVDLKLKRPVFIYLGRLAVEKNIEDFLKIKLPGTKLVIGDGPEKCELEKKYPEAVFVGYKKGKELTTMLSGGDVFVFPSKTDTFGLAILEAMACGLPVAAYNSAGPKDIITNGFDGFVCDNLEDSINECLKIQKSNPISTAKNFRWENMIKKFIAYQVINPSKKWKKLSIRKTFNLLSKIDI